jgi:glycosyltransferase involved in cell wall biosynthesis
MHGQTHGDISVAAGPEVSVVIPAFNEEHRIAACLHSLARQDTDRLYEVVLVDNNCTDRTLEVARASMAGLNLRIVHESRQGRGAARKAGFEAARAAILCSADADTRYPRDWLRTLVHALNRPHTVAASTSARIDDLAPWQNLAFNLSQPVAMWCYRLVFGHHCLSGFSFVVLRSVYEAAGGFDAELNADEDADLSRRVARFGTIRLVMHPVTMSGRRFRHGLLSGALTYLRLALNYQVKRTSARLSDIR